MSIFRDLIVNQSQKCESFINNILSAPPKFFLVGTPMSVRNSAFSDMAILE